MAEPSDRPEGWSDQEQARQNALRQAPAGAPEDGLSHPVATGVGALGGAAAGAAAGMVGGPVGSVAGAVAGAVLGGLGGNAVGAAIDPEEEARYWRNNYQREPYYQVGRSYDDYAPAYQLGLQGRTQYGDRFEDTENRLAQSWDSERGRSGLNWNDALEPSRAAWQRADQQLRARGLAGAGAGEGSSYTASLGSTGGSYLGSSTLRPPAGRNLPNHDIEDEAAMDGIIRPRSMPLDADAGTHLAHQTADGEAADNDDVIDVLNDLLECCRDGEYGFSQSAEHVQAASLKERLTQHADECQRFGEELVQRIRQRGGEPDEGGSASGALHRGWVSIKGRLAGYSDRAMLDECERGADAALSRYRHALQQELPTDARALVERQLEGMQRNHDEVKQLRDNL